jgi:hypothetical protein
VNDATSTVQLTPSLDFAIVDAGTRLNSGRIYVYRLQTKIAAFIVTLVIFMTLQALFRAAQAQDQNADGPVAAVTHLDKATCPADALKQLTERRQVKSPPAVVINVGNGYHLTRWPALDDQPTADPAVFVLLENAGRCQLLVADQVVEVTALHLPLSNAAPPQLIIMSYSGGAHCCFSYRIVSLGKQFAADLINGGSSPISLMGLGDSDTPVVTYWDMAFAYWQASFLESPSGQVRLVWDKDRYRLDDPKQQPAPSAASLAAWQAEMTAAIKAIPSPYVSITDQAAGKEAPHLDPVIWSHLIDLIYAGYPEMAVDLFNKAWPTEVAGKDVFWRDFVTQMKDGSVLWQPWDLAKVLKPELPKTP